MSSTASTAVGLQDVLRRGDSVVAVQVDGQAVLFEESLASLSLLDPIATAVWNATDGMRTVAELCDELAHTYSAPVSRVQADVVPLLARLVETRMLCT